MMGRGWNVAGCFVILRAVIALVPSAAEVPIDWETIAPMSLSRHSGAPIVDGLIYAIGGTDGTGAPTGAVFIGEVVDD